MRVAYLFVAGMKTNFTLSCYVTVYNSASNWQTPLGNTPGTAGGPGGHDRTLALKSRKTLKKSKSKYWGGELFRTWEIPRSGSKAKNGEREKYSRECWL